MNELEELKVRVDGLSAVIQELAIAIGGGLRVDINPIINMQRAIENRVGALYLKDIIEVISSNSLGLVKTPKNHLTPDDVYAFVSYFDKHEWLIERISAFRGQLINVPYVVGRGLKIGINLSGYEGTYVFKFSGNDIEYATPLSDLDVPRGVLLNSFHYGMAVGKYTDDQMSILEPLKHITSASMFYSACERLHASQHGNVVSCSGNGKAFTLCEEEEPGEICISEIPNPHHCGSHSRYIINNSNIDALNAIPVRMRLSVYDTYSWHLKGIEEEKRELEKGENNAESQSDKDTDQ